MQLQGLSLLHYRNITQTEFTPHPELTVICGNNGQGKTNLLEAIWLLTGGKSFRGSKDQDLIQKEKDFSVLDGTILEEDGATQTNLRITIGGAKTEYPGRQAKKNNVPVGRATLLAGTFPAVVFAPQHLSLVKGSPDGRRRFMDAALCQLYPNYLTIYRRYAKALAQKNAFLKQYSFADKPNDTANQILDVFDLEITKQGEEIQKRRLAFLSQLTPIAIQNYREISNDAETLNIKYLPQFKPGQFAEKLAAARSREFAARCCLVGPHREDFELQLNGEPAKVFASQGQQRSAVLSLKLAEATTTYAITGTQPVMLLDDVLSELDDTRQKYLLTRMQGKQVFVTSCDESAFTKTNGKIVVVKGGQIL